MFSISTSSPCTFTRIDFSRGPSITRAMGIMIPAEFWGVKRPPAKVPDTAPEAAGPGEAAGERGTEVSVLPFAEGDRIWSGARLQQAGGGPRRTEWPSFSLSSSL
jgi:hypothetical protein